LANCPFCSGGVDEDLIIYGGPCPNCFAEIPGEEAPTDPGEEKKRVIVAKEQRRAMIRAVIPFALATPVVFLLAILAVMMVTKPWQPDVGEFIDFDDDEYYSGFEFTSVTDRDKVAAVQPSPQLPVPNLEQPQPVAPVASGGHGDANDGGDAVAMADPAGNAGGDGDAPREELTPDQRASLMNNPLFNKSGSGDVGGPAADPFAGLERSGDDQRGGSTDGPRGTSGYKPADPGMPDLQPLSRGGSAGGGSTDLGSLEVGGAATVEREQGTMRQEEVKEHILEVMKANARRFKSCYELRLKENENLEGAWRIDFVVTKAGEVRDVKATGRNMTDEKFEVCLVKKVKEWRFAKLPADQPVGRSFTFRPSW
jgi:hypothetical protein